MKKIISNFDGLVLSRNQMKNVKGGDDGFEGGCTVAHSCIDTSDCKPVGCDGYKCKDNKCK